MIDVLSGGLFTTIQDLGRVGYRKYGVPVSGAMDDYSARLANRLVGNKRSNAVLEITFIGPVLRFTSSTEIAITGAGFSPTLNNQEVPLNTRLQIDKNSILKFGLPNYGLRAYLSVSGGLQTEKILGSYSYYRGITIKSSVETGDQLPIIEHTYAPERITSSVKIKRSHFSNQQIEVFKGPEFDQLPKEYQERLLNTNVVVLAESNRMAYMLSGFENISAKEIITAPVRPGIVQLTPSGKCIVLARDAQTTGGYARVLQLTERGINALVQKKANEFIHFSLVQ